jgi:hypothetical protein
MMTMLGVECKLEPNAVIERAKSVPGCRQVSAESGLRATPPLERRGEGTMICFLVGIEDASREAQDVTKLARINVFCDTGTVATCRILHGAVRQVFQRNVSSLDVLERILRYPPQLAIADESILVLEGRPAVATSAELHHQALELTDVGIGILQNEKEKLESHLSGLEELCAKKVVAAAVAAMVEATETCNDNDNNRGKSSDDENCSGSSDPNSQSGGDEDRRSHSNQVGKRKSRGMRRRLSTGTQTPRPQASHEPFPRRELKHPASPSKDTGHASQQDMTAGMEFVFSLPCKFEYFS